MLLTDEDKPIRKWVKRNLKAKYTDNSAYHIEYYHSVLAEKNAKLADYNERQRQRLASVLERNEKLKRLVKMNQKIIKRNQKIITMRLREMKRCEIVLSKQQILLESSNRFVVKQKKIVENLEFVNKFMKRKTSVESKNQMQ
jgi:hypothetical protein